MCTYVGTFLIIIKPQVFKNVHTYFSKKSRSVKVNTFGIFRKKPAESANFMLIITTLVGFDYPN